MHALQVGGEGPEDAETDQQPGPGHGDTPSGGDPIDEVTEHERPRHGGALAGQRGTKTDGETAPVAPEQRPQPAQPTTSPGRGHDGVSRRCHARRTVSDT